MTARQPEVVLLTKELIEIIVKVHDQLGDVDKTYTWLTVDNLCFGGISALRLIDCGRGHKVLQFIDDAIEGNLP